MHRKQTEIGLVEFDIALTRDGFDIIMAHVNGEHGEDRMLTDSECEEYIWKECEEIAREERQHKRDLEMEYWKERN